MFAQSVWYLPRITGFAGWAGYAKARQYPEIAVLTGFAATPHVMTLVDTGDGWHATSLKFGMNAP